MQFENSQTLQPQEPNHSSNIVCTEFWDENHHIKFDFYSDIKLIPLIQTDKDCFYIEATEYYSKLMSTFRGLMNIQEYSMRALELTSAVIKENPSDAAAWHYREEILAKISFDKFKELEYTDLVMNDGLKSYQAWYHRKWVVNQFQTPPKSLNLIVHRIQVDKRNFHAWEYILWIAKHFSLEKEILIITEDFIKEDRKNNSAWNTRFKLIIDTPSLHTTTTWKNEIDFSFSQIKGEGGNGPACSYIFGIVTQCPILVDQVKLHCVMLLKDYKIDRSLSALMFRISDFIGDKEGIEKYCNELSKKDTLRRKFWQKMKDNPEYFS